MSIGVVVALVAFFSMVSIGVLAAIISAVSTVSGYGKAVENDED